MTPTPADTVDRRVLWIVSRLTTVPLDQIGVDDRLRADLGLDSVASMELLGMLAEEFDIEVPMEETMEVERVEQVIALTRRHLAHA